VVVKPQDIRFHVSAQQVDPLNPGNVIAPHGVHAVCAGSAFTTQPSNRVAVVRFFAHVPGGFFANKPVIAPEVT
jgi:hypothetical protein